ncbi:efflux RND transporter permease subunit [Tautonia sociabilis]|uniref:Efflux RND transporter permease subunit n=1 Tax=Tautonia sociabilis TaxID=2080755 RepID=A0A432MPU1_9BACT|nr:efflux RND transporter permease subunit [Tautonia sociabilis]RUL89442.1 efflux RND transporter permease subunit [Tautonia sociabilis]
MLNAIIRGSLTNRLVVLFLAVLLLAAGGYTAATMPVDVFPDLTAPTVTVITEAYGMAPEEVETLVTFPIEAAVNGASGVRRVRSATAVGISVVWVEFEWDTDIYIARQIVNEKLSLVSGSLPPEVERPILAPISSIMGEILFLSLTSDRHSGIELRTVADTRIRRRLLSVPGVSQVVPIGGGVKQYQVVLSPERLKAYGIGVAEVADRLRETNQNVSAGFLIEGGQEQLIQGIGRVRDPADIADTVVAVRDGVPIRVGQLGLVQIGEAIKRGEGSADAEPAVILGVQKQPDTNTLALTAALDATLDEIEATLPEGMEIDRDIFRQADFIAVAVRNVEEALRDGGILVVIIVLLFLANLRASFITLLAIPLSLVTAVLVLKAFGATINTMTLGGMAIAIGDLVDDAIIDVENVVRRLRENAGLPEGRRRNPLAVIYHASVEVRSSVVFATLIILLVFLPIFFLGGVEGRMLRPLGVAYVVALFASLVVSLTITPALCSLLLPRSRAILGGREPLVVRALKWAYGRVLGPTLRHPWAVLVPALALLVVAVAAIPFLGRAFLPEFNEGALTISAVTLPGTSLPESDKLGRVVERVLMAHPEVTGVARRTGRAELSEHAQGVEAAELDVSFRLGEGRSKEEFLAELRRDFTLVPGMSIVIGQPISHRIDHMLSGTRANVAVKIFGEDLYKLRALAEDVRREMAAVPGVVDLAVEQQMDIPIVKVRFDRPTIARHGLTVTDVAEAVDTAFRGQVVSQVLEGRYAFDLVVRVGDPKAIDRESIENLPVDTPRGAKVPLKALARIVRSTGPNQISRENVQRKIVVMCNVADRDVISVVEDIRERVAERVPIGRGQYEGYFVEYGGQFESAQETTRRLTLLGVAVIIGIGFLLNVAFGSTRDALLVMVNLPLALIGGVVGVYLSGGVLSVASLIGFITLFGLATRNGIMMVSHIRHLQQHEEVASLPEAVYLGAMERLAPILMTALTAGLALIPLALGGDKPGSEIQTPMALVILCGLTTSTALNMFVVPALYLRFGRPAPPVEGAEGQILDLPGGTAVEGRQAF